ncbi:MAG: hypothetical protein QXI84_10900 [Thermofilaceae archaeon]
MRHTLVVYPKKRVATVVAYLKGATVSRRGVSLKTLKKALPEPRRTWAGGATYKIDAAAFLQVFPRWYLRRYCNDAKIADAVDAVMKEAYKAGLLKLNAKPKTIEAWLGGYGHGIEVKDLDEIDYQCFGMLYGKYYISTPPWCCEGI